MLGKHDKQYTKAEWEIIDVMREESSEKNVLFGIWREPKYTVHKRLKQKFAYCCLSGLISVGL